MIKILTVSELYWPEGGGGVLATHLIVGLLRSLGFSVTVVHGSLNPEVVDGVGYVYSGLLSVRDKFRLWFNCLRLGGSGWFVRLLREYDVLYVPRYCYPLVPIAKRLGKRVVVHVHDYQPISYNANVPAPYEVYRGGLRGWVLEVERSKGFGHYIAASLFWWLPRLAQVWLSDADTVIFVSRRQAEIITSSIESLDRGRVVVMYNPIPVEIFNNLRKELSDVPTFLYAGGEEYIKGFHILLQALQELRRRGVRAKFIFTNNYSSRSLEKITKLRSKYMDIDVVGRVPYERLLRFHESSWALLFPSIWEEPLPYVVVESITLGTIPIASRVGGVPEIVEGTYAERFLFEPGDVGGFVGKVEEVASMRREDVWDIGAKLREEVLRRFDVDKIKSQLLSIFG